MLFFFRKTSATCFFILNFLFLIPMIVSPYFHEIVHFCFISFHDSSFYVQKRLFSCYTSFASYSFFITGALPSHKFSSYHSRVNFIFLGVQRERGRRQAGLERWKEEEDGLGHGERQVRGGRAEGSKGNEETVRW